MFYNYRCYGRVYQSRFFLQSCLSRDVGLKLHSFLKNVSSYSQKYTHECLILLIVNTYFLLPNFSKLIILLIKIHEAGVIQLAKECIRVEQNWNQKRYILIFFSKWNSTETVAFYANWRPQNLTAIKMPSSAAGSLKYWIFSNFSLFMWYFVVIKKNINCYQPVVKSYLL